jgi:light-regulated signal transduction histidine kinase (bacteriophytochrome)
MKTRQALKQLDRGRGMGIRQTTVSDVASRQVPVRLAGHIHRGHLIAGMRDIPRIGRKSWEQAVVDMQRLNERRLHSKANRFHNAVKSARTLLGEVQRRKEIVADIRRKGDFVQLTISDSGGGIAAEHLEKIFSPFQTTKLVSKGRGLAPSVRRSIVGSNGGKISCKSEVKKGTTITVLLPMEKKEP